MLTRYGVFLRPDPPTCLAISTITGALRAQYGLVSAAAFPPHATLAGSLPLGESAAGGVPGPVEDDALRRLGAGLDRMCAEVAPFPVENVGVRIDGAVIYAVHDWDGAPNAELVDLADRVTTLVRPLLVDVGVEELPADLHPREEWRGHLSLASHDLQASPGLTEEVYDFVVRLGVSVPACFDAEWLALYRFEHPDWRDGWWRALRWSHVRSWRLGEGVAGAAP